MSLLIPDATIVAISHGQPLGPTEVGNLEQNRRLVMVDGEEGGRGRGRRRGCGPNVTPHARN